jgi:hypothetical protein
MRNDQNTEGLASSYAASAELVALPGHLRPGVYSLFFDQGNLVEAAMVVNAEGGGLSDVDLRVSATLLGHYSQDVGFVRGSAAMVGLGTGFRYHDSWRLGRRDHFAIAHLPGLRARTWLMNGPLRMRGELEAHIDFAAVRPLAFAAYAAEHGTDGLKSVLVRQSYAFAWGGSGRATVGISGGPLELRGLASIGRYRSIQGLDRHQEAVEREAPSVDSLLELASSLAVRGTGPFDIRLDAGRTLRWGSMGGLEQNRWDRHVSLGFEYVF